MLLSRLKNGEYFEYKHLHNGSTFLFEDCYYTLSKNLNYCKYDLYSSDRKFLCSIDIDIFKCIDEWCTNGKLNVKISLGDVNIDKINDNIASINRKNKLKRLLSC